MELSPLTAALQSVKAARDLFTAMQDLQVDAAVRTAIFEALNNVGEAQDKLRDLRDELFALQERNRELEQKLLAIDEWKEVSSHYALVKSPAGANVFRFDGQPEHFACPRCFNAHRLSYLQPWGRLRKFRCLTRRNAGQSTKSICRRATIYDRRT